MPTRDTGRPVVVVGGLESAQLLDRVDLTDKTINEGWLQQLVFEHPSVLPIDDFDESFRPLIPIGREVESGAGPIDVLLVSPSATLTIVETKLWRNPESRRQVVAQIIDYAAALARWSYEHLDEVTRACQHKSLWELVQGVGVPGEARTEGEFVDAAVRNLRQGRFLLLLVGDGIREEVEQMVGFVQSQPQLQFTLGMVELQIFERVGRNERLVVPSVIARTAEVTRSVVEVNVAPETRVEVQVTVPGNDAATTRAKLDEDRFFADLAKVDRLDDTDIDFVRAVKSVFEADPRFYVTFGQKSLMIKRRRLMPGVPSTVIGFFSGGRVFIGWLGQQSPDSGAAAELSRRFAAETAENGGHGRES